jgi:excinuclease UvrABC helicase subunit UvrB
VQLAARTPAQLHEHAERLRAGMAAAAADLRFEDAAALRDDLTRVEDELARRGGIVGP